MGAEHGSRLNMQCNPITKKTIILLLAVMSICALPKPAGRCAWSQETPPEGFIGHGRSPIVASDIAGARQQALLDAQGKAVLAAISELMPLETFSKYYLTIYNLFLAQPQPYVERFKLLNEGALLDTYQLTIEGFVPQDVLKQELASLGMLAADNRSLRALVLAAETHPAGGQELYWWHVDPAMTTNRSQQRLEYHLQQGGAQIITPAAIDQHAAWRLLGERSEPDPQGIRELAALAGARVAVVAKTRLAPSAVPGMASLYGVQCDLMVAVYRADDPTPLIQSATHALGQHLDEAAATDTAIDKACAAIASQIMDVLHMQMRAMHAFRLNIAFADRVNAAQVEAFPAALRAACAQLETTASDIAADGRSMTLQVESREESGRFLQRLYEAGIPGYSVEVASATEQDIHLRVSGATGGAP
jgi:hypothetical protein